MAYNDVFLFYSWLIIHNKLLYFSVILIERMEISEKMPIIEGTPLLIACIVRGGPKTNVKWLKDDSPIVFPPIHGRLWKSTIPKNSYNTFTFLLGIDKTHVLDSGRKLALVFLLRTIYIQIEHIFRSVSF